MQQQASSNSLLAISNLGQISQLSFEGLISPIYYYKNPIILNKQYSHDIIPGIYQGGFQLWECEIEFLKKIFESLKSGTEQFDYRVFQSRRVIEIGCGHGLLAIASEKLGAKEIILQDYNENVLKELTQKTVENLNKVDSNKCKYISGDWDNMAINSQQDKYDIILGSQVTYKQQNYMKIINFLLRNMKHSGVCYLANKNYYFGVGGNLPSFKQKIQEHNLIWRIVWKIIPKSGNKKQIIEIKFNSNLSK